jgi:hypothetical protein
MCFAKKVVNTPIINTPGTVSRTSVQLSLCVWTPKGKVGSYLRFNFGIHSEGVVYAPYWIPAASFVLCLKSKAAGMTAVRAAPYFHSFMMVGH